MSSPQLSNAERASIHSRFKSPPNPAEQNVRNLQQQGRSGLSSKQLPSPSVGLKRPRDIASLASERTESKRAKASNDESPKQHREEDNDGEPGVADEASGGGDLEEDSEAASEIQSQFTSSQSRAQASSRTTTVDSESSGGSSTHTEQHFRYRYEGHIGVDPFKMATSGLVDPTLLGPNAVLISLRREVIRLAHLLENARHAEATARRKSRDAEDLCLRLSRGERVLEQELHASHPKLQDAVRDLRTARRHREADQALINEAQKKEERAVKELEEEKKARQEDQQSFDTQIKAAQAENETLRSQLVADKEHLSGQNEQGDSLMDDLGRQIRELEVEKAEETKKREEAEKGRRVEGAARVELERKMRLLIEAQQIERQLVVEFKLQRGEVTGALVDLQ